MTVAPLVGAWIEIHNYQVVKNLHPVAPLVGAWIEMQFVYRWYNVFIVAPLVGAWIEIDICSTTTGITRSLPSWERGLK